MLLVLLTFTMLTVLTKRSFYLLSFLWWSGEEITWSDWAPGEPQSFGDCMTVQALTPSSILWRVDDCSTHYSFICQLGGL